MFSSSIHLYLHDKISIFFVTEYNSIVYKYHVFLIHSFVVGHFGYFHSLTILNNASINMEVGRSGKGKEIKNLNVVDVLTIEE
jgi:hypothetical protein